MQMNALLGLHHNPVIHHQGRASSCPMISKLKSSDLNVSASDNGLWSIEAIHIKPLMATAHPSHLIKQY
jgi:hypothetical protein